jgi:ATP-dependent DNA ligase
VIGGYTDPQGGRSGFGALLLGHYSGRKLVYAGKVGTGFNQDLLRRLGEKLAGLETPVSRSSSLKSDSPSGRRAASCDIRDSSACEMISGRKMSCVRADVR